jgi:signal peptidase II
VGSGRIAFVVIAVIVFVLDRVTKSLVTSQIPYGTEVPVFGRLLGITNFHNSGAAFGLVPAAATFFLLASIVVAIGLVVYVARTPSNLWTDAVLGLILGGTLGNGYDRIMFGTVTDFINFHFWPVFNVADASISVGVVALVAGYLSRKPAV